MNVSNNITDRDDKERGLLREEYRRLSSLYFDGDTTLRQERRLRELSALLADDGDTDKATAAVFSYMTERKRRGNLAAEAVRRGGVLRFARSISAVAAVAVVAVCAISLFSGAHGTEAMICRAGQPSVTDVETVTASALSDLSAIGEAHECTRLEVADDLGIFFK